MAPKEEGPEEGRGGRLGSAGVCSYTQDDDPEGPAGGGPGWEAGVRGVCGYTQDDGPEGPAGNYTQRLTINHNGRDGVCMCDSAAGLQSRNERSTGNQLPLDDRKRTRGRTWRPGGGAPGGRGHRAPRGHGHLRAVSYLPGVGGSWAQADSELTSLVRHHHLWLSRTQSQGTRPQAAGPRVQCGPRRETTQRRGCCVLTPHASNWSQTSRLLLVAPLPQTDTRMGPRRLPCLRRPRPGT